VQLRGGESWISVLDELAIEAVGGAVLGFIGGRAIVLALNRLSLPQGLHAPLVATGALVVFALAQVLHASGFLAVYLAGLMVGNRPTRAHNAVIAPRRANGACRSALAGGNAKEIAGIVRGEIIGRQERA